EEGAPGAGPEPIPVYVCFRYRPATANLVALIRSRLGERARPGYAFLDADQVGSGEDWPEALARAIDSCRVMLVVFGPDLLPMSAEGDRVRLEIRTALERGVPVIPVVARRDAFPRRDDLPDDVAGLADRQAA